MLVLDSTSNQVVMADVSIKVLSSLQRQCAVREYCKQDVYKKALRALDGDSAAAQEIISSLVKDKYIDELRYALAFARDKSSLSGWGDRKIAFALSAKGLEEAVIREALEGIDRVCSNKKMEAVLTAKYRQLKNDHAAKLKLLKFGLGRGWDYEQLKVVVDKLLNA